MKRGEGLRVAVVGAGLGGISAAISLASEGFSVDVFEKNGQIGGKLNIGERDGFNFDLGPVDPDPAPHLRTAFPRRRTSHGRLRDPGGTVAPVAELL